MRHAIEVDPGKGRPTHVDGTTTRATRRTKRMHTRAFGRSVEPNPMQDVPGVAVEHVHSSAWGTEDDETCFFAAM